MTSSSHGSAWTPILLEAAKNVRSHVQVVLSRRPKLAVAELKRLLDSKAQEAILETLEHRNVSAQLISEEGDATLGDGGVYIVADPVDGTTNLARGLPYAVTSLAVSETPWLSGTIAGLVVDLNSGEVYRGESGVGAWRGGTPIYPAGPKRMTDALISFDISKGAPLKAVERLIAGARHLRQLGSAAISLCLVASGALDAHVDLRGMLRATDVAAGLLILKESGGVFSVDGVVGGDLELTRQSKLDLVAASGPEMFEGVLGLVE